MKTILIS